MIIQMANGSYYVQTSTNLAVPLANWTLLCTNNFDANGALIVTNPIIADSSQRFFLLKR